MVKPYIYVTIVSEHNLPSLLSILTLRPEKVVLVVTQRFSQPFNNPQNAATPLMLLKERIQQHLPDTHIVDALPCDDLSGESVQEMQHWITQYFVPFYKQNGSAYRWVLNVNGGTKIMSMLLETADAINWDEVHYKGIKDPKVQRWSVQNKQRHVLECLPLEPISPLDALALYTRFEVGTANRIEQSSAAVPIAQQIWDYYASDDPTNPHIALSQALDHIWSRPADFNQRMVLIPWGDINTPEHKLRIWLQTLQHLTGDESVFNIKDEGIEVPGNKFNNSRHDKLHKEWKKWISGLWLETLVAHWLNQIGVLVERNIKVINQNRELDFVLLYQHNLLVIEAKSAPAADKELSEIIRQIKSVTDVGKLTNYLVISPYFTKVAHNSPDKMEAFEDNCKLNQIRLLQNREALINLFKT